MFMENSTFRNNVEMVDMISIKGNQGGTDYQGGVSMQMISNKFLDNTDIDSGSLPSREIADFLSSEGTVFDVLKAQAVWSRVTLNRGMFPTFGSSTDMMLQATIRGSDLTYYKTNFRQKFYRPLGFSNLVFGFDGELGYIGAYGDTEKKCI